MGISYLLSKTMQPYVVGIREPEVSSLEVDADSLSIRATVTFVAQCESCGDKPINCAPRPYKYGDFAYWESSENILLISNYTTVVGLKLMSISLMMELNKQLILV